MNYAETFNTVNKGQERKMKTTHMNVEYVDHMGSDLSVVNAARVSFAKVKQEFDSDDAKLISYLAKHNHWSPFAHAALSVRIKAPIFVARQLVKHQIGLSWNEVSRRYVSDDPEFYFPTEWRAAPTEGAKQGSSDGADLHQSYCNSVHYDATMSGLMSYHNMLGQGVAPEMARMVLPQNMMTEWIWTGSVYAFARVCNLRLDAHAQAETTVVAQGIERVCGDQFPVSWDALVTSRADHV